MFELKLSLRNILQCSLMVLTYSQFCISCSLRPEYMSCNSRGTAYKNEKVHQGTMVLSILNRK